MSRNRTPHLRPTAGFTVTELAVTVAVAAILTTVAVPSFSSLMASQRAKSTASELYVTLMRTRSEAIMRNANIQAAPTGSAWNQGWQITDQNGNALDNHGAITGVTITGPATLTFRPSGRVQAGAAQMFVVTSTLGASVSYECVSLSLNGRPYMTAAQTC